MSQLGDCSNISKDPMHDSSASIKQNLFKTNQDLIEKGLQTSFKSLNNSLYTTINNAFSNFNLDYEKRVDKNREVHEKAVTELTNDLKTIHDKNRNIKNKQSTVEDSMVRLYGKMQGMKFNSKFLKILFALKENQKFSQRKNKLALDYLAKKKIKSIFTSWRNIVNSLQKTRIKIKYGNLFDEKYKELNANYSGDLARLQSILDNLESDIQKEIDERKNLSKLYDQNLNKGVQVLINETDNIVDFNSSGKIEVYLSLAVSTPNERSYRKQI